MTADFEVEDQFYGQYFVRLTFSCKHATQRIHSLKFSRSSPLTSHSVASFQVECLTHSKAQSHGSQIALFLSWNAYSDIDFCAIVMCKWIISYWVERQKTLQPP
jgi:hypothetical protein